MRSVSIHLRWLFDTSLWHNFWRVSTNTPWRHTEVCTVLSFFLISLPLTHANSHWPLFRTPLWIWEVVAVWTQVVTVLCGILLFLHEAEDIRTNDLPLLELLGSMLFLLGSVILRISQALTNPLIYGATVNKKKSSITKRGDPWGFVSKRGLWRADLQKKN